MIKIEHVTKSFGRFKALDDVSLDLEQGRTISLLGPNGSGKTTLIKSVLGLVIPERGTIEVNGQRVKNNWQYRSHIGYMPQIGRYPDNMTIEQVLNMIKEIRREHNRYDNDLIEGFELKKIQHKTMRSLSGGMRQKVSACLAFLFSPDILVLDEPTAGLDPVSSEMLKEKIIHEQDSGKLILITSHVLSDLEGLTSHIIYMQEGKPLFYKSTEELQEITGEEKLNRIIAHIIKRQQQAHKKGKEHENYR